MAYWRHAFLGLGVLGSGWASAESSDRVLDSVVKRATLSQEQSAAVFYGRIDLRHQINTFYDDDGYLQRQEPVGQVRARIGASLYKGMVDAYATVGVVKKTDTLQLVQRRPEMAVEIFPIANEYLLVNQYHLIDLPFSEATYDAANAIPQRQGAVYRPGIALTTFVKVGIPLVNLTVKGGIDLWTEVYSRRQYVLQDDREQRFSLARNPTTGDPIEIRNPKIFTEYMLAFAADDLVLSGFATEVGLYYDNFFTESSLQSVEPVVATGVTRESFVKWRLGYQINSSLQIVNDFFRYYDGLLESQPREERRTYRNILRLVQNL